MSSLASGVLCALSLVVLAGNGPPGVRAQEPAAPPTPLVIGATVAERQEAARALVPLLSEVQAHAKPGVTVKSTGGSPSPLTGQNSTLFAFTISRRSVPVDTRVVAAMMRLLSWDVAGAPAPETFRLFDAWLVELQTRAAAAAALKATGQGVCDVNCVVQRMTTLDAAWGASPKGRKDARDELLLESLTAAVLTPR